MTAIDEMVESYRAASAGGTVEPGASTGPAPEVAWSKWTSPVARARQLGRRGVRLPTGIDTLDAVTRGGLPAGGVVVVGGAPGAGKTTLLVQLARRYHDAGHIVGVLAADEHADRLLIRWGQLTGLSRESLENGEDEAREALASAVDSPRFFLVDQDEDTATLDLVATRLLVAQRELTSDAAAPVVVLIVDSVQTVRCDAAADSSNPREATDAKVDTLKRIAKRDGFLVIFTSELARGAYRGGPGPKTDALASFKESGSIEYGVDVAIAMTSVRGGSDDVDAEIPKNRLGRKERFRLRLDRERASMVEIELPPEDGADDPAASFEADVGAVRRALARHPGINGNDALLAKACADRQMGKGRARAALRALDARGEVRNAGAPKRPRLYWNDPANPHPPESPESPGECGPTNPPESPHPVGGRLTGRVTRSG